MNRRRSSCLVFEVAFVAPLLLILPSCMVRTFDEQNSRLPSSESALRAVDESLSAWRKSPDFPRTTESIRPIMFVDQQQPLGQRLVKYETLGESPGQEGYRRIQVRLFLEDPQESAVVAYFVFGEDPIWVYRAEDFDMIMHMDKSMMAESPPADSISELAQDAKEDPSKQSSGVPNTGPRSKR